MKRTATWEEERYGFEFKVLDGEDKKAEVIKTLTLLRVPEPYKKRPDDTVETEKIKNEKILQEKLPKVPQQVCIHYFHQFRSLKK
jgi:hypothetical protein